MVMVMGMVVVGVFVFVGVPFGLLVYLVTSLFDYKFVWLRFPVKTS